jgi:hypothetical protein
MSHRQLPGTATIVFTNLVASTALRVEIPLMMIALRLAIWPWS